MRTSKHYLFRACYSKGVSLSHLHLVHSKAGRGLGKLYSRGVKVIFTGGHISLTVAFKGSNVISTP